MQNAMVKVVDAQAAVPDADLAGEDGSVEVLVFDEAASLADMIQTWIEKEGMSPSGIAILVSKQAALYAGPLMAELKGRNVPFRNEQSIQDLTAEPVARLIVDFLTVVFSDAAPDAFCRLTNIFLTPGLDDDSNFDIQNGWRRYLDNLRNMIYEGAFSPLSATSFQTIANDFLAFVGRSRLYALAADYQQGTRLDDIIQSVYQHIKEVFTAKQDPVRMLAAFSEDTAVRILTIHKSKGLEFDTVILLGVENETFWGNLIDERSVFFVAISRAKRRLFLSTAGKRSRPSQFPGRWNEIRSPQCEFLSYALETV
jgi:superfamily I DNA/RNA helicase